MGDRIRRLIRPGSVIRLIFSLVLALIVWGFIVWETNPERTRVERDVPITAVNLAPNMRVVDELPPATITMKGPRSVIERITSTMVSAYVDMEGVTTVGTVERPVQVDVPDGLRQVSVEPETVEIQVDEFIGRTFQIELQELEARPANVTDVHVQGNLAEVRGSRQAVTQVSRVVANVDLSGRGESFSEEVPLVALDENGIEVPDVTVVPSTVEVEVAFSSTERFVPVTVICRCQENGQLRIVEFPEAAAIPSTVQVSGPETVLSNVTSIPTEPVDISGLDESGWILEVELDISQLSSDIQFRETTVDVWVPIELQRLAFDDLPISVINLEDGFTAQILDRTASLVVRGPRSALDKLEGNPPSVVVNASGRQTGSYVVDVQVVLPPEVTYEQLSPAQVDLIIERETVPNVFDSLPSDGVEVEVMLAS